MALYKILKVKETRFDLNLLDFKPALNPRAHRDLCPNFKRLHFLEAMSAKITSVAEGLLAAKALEEAGVRHCYMPCNACVQGEDLLKFATPSSVLEALFFLVRWKKNEFFFFFEIVVLENRKMLYG